MRCLCGESFSFVSLFFCCAQKNAFKAFLSLVKKTLLTKITDSANSPTLQTY